jgi:hypothetical protein
VSHFQKGFQMSLGSGGWRRQATLLVIHEALTVFFGGHHVVSQRLAQCFAHDDCSDPQHFCAWSECEDEVGERYPCGGCKPCTECLCDSDSSDFRCPLDRCTAQPINGVRFLQGFFHNHSVLEQVPDYNCVRRLVITGNIFSIIQLPVYKLHPATTAMFNESDSQISKCPSYTRHGILKSSRELINGTLKLVAVISSEGMLFRHAEDTTAANASFPRGSNGGVGSAAKLPLRPPPEHPSRRHPLQRRRRELQQLA